MEQQSQGSPHSDLAARREARRRKILENSNNRLGKITGREHNEPLFPIDSTTPQSEQIYPDPEIERDTFEANRAAAAATAGPSSTAHTQNIFELLNSLKAAEQPATPGGTSHATRQSLQPETRITRLLHSKLHIMALAVLIYVLVVTGNSTIGSSVFVLLLAWEVVEVLLLKTYANKNNFLEILFLLGGISPQYGQAIVRIFETLNKVLKDVAIFIFFFVAMHLLWGKLVEHRSWSAVLYAERNWQEEDAAATMSS